MAIIDVIVDNKLRLDGNCIGHDLWGDICDELIIPNSAYHEAVERGQAKGIPKEFFMCDMEGDTCIMERGYAKRLKEVLWDASHDVHWIDRRQWERGTEYGREEFNYRLHQPPAVRATRLHQQGIYQAPAGSGKTVTVCGLLWETHPRHSLILVDRINLVDQWISRIRQHIGKVAIGKIGEGKWSEGRVNVATVQTLIRKLAQGGKEALKVRNFLNKQSIVVLDEMHHVTAETFQTVVSECPARIRIGVSATPDKTGEFEVAVNTLGEVYFKTSDDELRELGFLVEPHVEVVYTNFEHEYWGDHQANKKGQCEKHGCKNKEPKHRHRNNYMQVKQALVVDENRNRQVWEELGRHYGHCQVVVTDQVKQIDALLEVMPDGMVDHVYVVTGKHSGKKREEIFESLGQKSNYILLSTIIGEAADIPSIDRIHLPFPTKNHGKVIQNLGRGTRWLEGKEDVIVIDYADINVKPLAKQFLARRWKAYEPKGLKVILPDDRMDDNSDRRSGGIGHGLLRPSLR